jgi:omega-amidase
MKITLCQFNLKWLDKKANLDYVNNVITHNVGSDLLILPEMFNTGYIMKPEDGAEDLAASHTISEIQAMLKNSSMIVGGTIPTLNAGRYYNSFVFLSHDSITYRYDKVHLFKMAGEGRAYSSGVGSSIYNCNGVMLRPLICYDLRFPYVSFQEKGNYHDVLIYSANWPVRRIDHWHSLLVARAIENQCYVIGVNRVGSDQNDLNYNGHSLAVDYSGHIMADLDTEEGYKTIHLDLDAMNDYRSKLPFLKDALL